MNYELLRAFCLGVSLSFLKSTEQAVEQQDKMGTVTKLLRQIASGDITLYESPDDENARHLTNVIVRNQRDLAVKIVNEMGEEKVEIKEKK